MKYYKLTADSGEEFYINSKSDLSDEEIFEQAVEEGLVDAFGFDEYVFDEVSEEEYDENA